MDNLKIYQKSLLLVKEIYRLIKIDLALTKDYSLCDQLKRSTISVASNIAEGYCRTNKQFKNYLQIASGSTNEVVTLLKIVFLVYGIDTIYFQEQYKYLGKQINSFSNKLI